MPMSWVADDETYPMKPCVMGFHGSMCCVAVPEAPTVEVSQHLVVNEMVGNDVLVDIGLQSMPAPSTAVRAFGERPVPRRIMPSRYMWILLFTVFVIGGLLVWYMSGGHASRIGREMGDVCSSHYYRRMLSRAETCTDWPHEVRPNHEPPSAWSVERRHDLVEVHNMHEHDRGASMYLWSEELQASTWRF